MVCVTAATVTAAAAATAAAVCRGFNPSIDWSVPPLRSPARQDWSWNKPANDYIQLYYSAME